MGYAATYLARETGAETFLRDSVAIKESYKSFYRYLEDLRPDYLFVESASPSWPHDAEHVRRMHKLLPHMRIVVTGPITSTQATSILEDLPVHACIKGEYEKGSVQVIEGKDGVLDYDLLTLEEMNASPYPYFDEQIAHRYWDENPKGQIFPHAQVWSSRGCPFKCIFCVWPATMTGSDPDGDRPRTVRHYSPDYMEGFLREIVDRYGCKSIYFDDDTFNLGTSHVRKMCQVMERIGLPWSAMCRADTSKMELWEMMRDAGCFGVKLGFESGSQEVVNNIVNKRLDLDYGREVVFELKRLGMNVHGTFTYGLPGETREQMLETKAYIASMPLDTLQESGTAEIEGTPLHALGQKGSLESYEGAVIDDQYRPEQDGARKFDSLVEELRSS